MPVAVNDDQSALAQTVAAFCERHGARESNRKDTLNHKAGERPDHWLELISLGLHAVHLSDDVGGQGGSIEDLAVVVGEAGRALLPGPLLPTVCQCNRVDRAHRRRCHRHPQAVGRWNHRDGTRGGFVPTITQRTGRLRLDGLSAATLGAASAELYVVAAQPGAPGAAPLWFVIEGRSAGIDIDIVDGVDLGRDVAVVKFCDVDVTGAVRLIGIDTDRAVDITVAMMAVDAAGIIAWCSNAATEFVKSRNQFGRPIGAFQAVAHRAAQLRITSELATASAWDAVRGLAETPMQRRHGVAGAAIMALGRAVHAAVE
jgi:alkylation response protein AidB-like acyl-CoA dehydrogenase